MGVIRCARSEDCRSLAELILMSDSGLLPALLTGAPRTVLTLLASRRRNPFSYEHGWVVDEDATVVGAAVGARPQTIRRERLSTALLIAAYYGVSAPARFAQLAKANAATEGLEPGDFYLSNIAVFPDWRGSGLGTRLLLHVEDTAKADGAERMVLDVDRFNERAVAFYHRLGYRGERRVSIDLGQRHRFVYRRLWKPLDGLPFLSETFS